MEQTPWINEEQIRVGPISDEQRRAIDAQLARLLVQHRIVCGFGAVTKPSRCAPRTRAASAVQNT